MTDTTDIKALRNRAASEVIANKGLISAELAMILINQLEAERQRVSSAEKDYLNEVDARTQACLAAWRLEAELAALKAKLANPVALPAGYSARAGHPFHEGERNVMIPNKHGDWLSRFEVEHAIYVAGFPFSVKGE